VCTILGPFVVVLERGDGLIDRSAPIADLGAAERMARGAAAFHQARAHVERAIAPGVALLGGRACSCTPIRSS
jgi:hypothetical protein